MLIKDDNWIEHSDILSIFPTFVWTIQTRPEFYEKVNAKLLKALNRMNPDLAEIQPGYSWQSHQQLHKSKEFIDLAPRILTYSKNRVAVSKDRLRYDRGHRVLGQYQFNRSVSRNS